MGTDLFGRCIARRQIGAYALHLSRYEPHSHIPPHAHDAAFATVILAGGYRETAGRETRDCAPQSIVVHEPGERHADTFAARRTTCLSVHGKPFDRSAHLTGAAAAAITMKLRAEFRAPDAFSPMVVEALMLELFAASARRREASAAPPWLREVRAVIDRRFCDPLTLSALAEDAGVHVAHLARAFRRQYGATIGETLRDLRLAYARQRLSSAAPLHEIAADAGFADQSHFTRAFRRATGMTPAAFRRAQRAF